MRERFVDQKHMYESSESARIGEKQAYPFKFDPQQAETLI